ncbi:hypothetical protein HHI36_014686 [Cryptolaemus montrouzieri]|uniref:PiggyBac transposable element-derived protein domain-containing protein n=1 Tax=Cryptolaemus montrouzieri TaxID=559131 RepID=A0ABD2N3X3_9CUCU
MRDMVDQTNLYATQIPTESEEISRHSRLHRWVPTNENELNFIGIIAYIGLHFSNNEECPEGDRSHKIQPLLDCVNRNYQAIYTSGGTFCAHESIIPFQGRLVIKQNIPQKLTSMG